MVGTSKREKDMVLRFKILLAHLALIVCANSGLQSATDDVMFCFVNNQAQPVQFIGVRGLGRSEGNFCSLGNFAVAPYSFHTVKLPREFSQGVMFSPRNYINGEGIIQQKQKWITKVFSNATKKNISVMVKSWKRGTKSIEFVQDDSIIEIIMAAHAEEEPAIRRSAATMTGDDLATELADLDMSDTGITGKTTDCAAGGGAGGAGAGSSSVDNSKENRAVARWRALYRSLKKRAVAEQEDVDEEVENAEGATGAVLVGVLGGGGSGGAAVADSDLGTAADLGGEDVGEEPQEPRLPWYWRALGY